MKKLAIFLLIFLINSQVFAKEIKNPNLIARTKDGEFNLKSFAGKRVIVNFWVSWCSNCKAEMKILSKIHQKYQDKNLQIIGISVDEENNYQDFEKIANKLSYPNFIIHDLKKNDFGNPIYLPTTYFIDEKGVAKIIKSDAALAAADFESLL